MQKNTLNLLVDVGAFLLVLSLLATGIMLRLVLPPGLGRGNWTVWGLTRHQWGSVHFWIAVVAVVVLLVHVVLHWTWVWNVSRSLAHRPAQAGRAQRYIGGGVVLLATLAGLGLFWRSASTHVQPAEPARSGAGLRQPEGRPARLRGSRGEDRWMMRGESQDQPGSPPQRRRRGGREQPGA